ncbi:MAG: ABC transporter ATP-binding protein [Planctomycetes bacterium]|nr:ABC transporter ATP-binding protein [Planctomycetota bacterium]
MICVRDLSKRFGPTLAVDRISFEIGRGEIVGFLGPNGAGKTTTIRVLTGFHPATSGSASIDGHDVATASLAARRRIGYLPENVPIYPDLRVVEYLRYRAALKGVPARSRRAAVAQAMARAGIEEVARKLCGHVSRGYRQRVGLADALVANPPILILDEPTSGLDPNQRRRIKQVVRELAQEHTVLFSSHILTEVEDVSSRIIVIHRGRLRADGPARELVARSAARRLRVRAACDLARLTELVRGIAGLTVDRGSAAPPDAAVVEASVAAAAEPAAEVGRRLLAAGIAVHELQVALPTLEEYFHAVTEGSDRAEEHQLAAAAEGAA